jgi:hypothetical protein
VIYPRAEWKPLTIVVSFDVGEQVVPGGIAGWVASQVHEFGFQSAKATFHWCIVPAISLPAHGLDHPGGAENLAVIGGGASSPAEDGNRRMVDILTAVLTDGLPAVEAACAEVIAQGVHSADVVLNILSRQRAGRDRQFGHVATAPIFRNCQRRRSDNRHTARPGPWDTLRRAASLRHPSFGTQKIPTCGISRRADSFMLSPCLSLGRASRLNPTASLFDEQPLAVHSQMDLPGKAQSAHVSYDSHAVSNNTIRGGGTSTRPNA